MTFSACRTSNCSVFIMNGRSLVMVLLVLVIIAMSAPVTIAGSKVKMRIVHDAANYGYFANSIAGATNQMQLVAKVKPANFSGPSLLKQLIGNCYNTTIDRYEYVFCPFQNMTQYETVPRWNAYQGVLGVWGHWRIENNTFVSMVLTHGDTCGDLDRSVEVTLQCGRKNELLNVTEPKSCRYIAVFTTRLLCHNDSLLVYPRLSSELQNEWDHLWTDYKMGYISEKGYNVSLIKMFREAGFISFEPEDAPKDSKKTENLKHDTEHNESVDDLSNCRKEYKKLKDELDQLKEEIDALKLLLDLNKMRTQREPEK